MTGVLQSFSNLLFTIPAILAAFPLSHSVNFKVGERILSIVILSAGLPLTKALLYVLELHIAVSVPWLRRAGEIFK